MAEPVKHFLHQGLKDHSPGILHLVFAVAETHHLALGRYGLIQKSPGVVWTAHLFEHSENILVGSAMQRSGQGAHS